MAGAKFKQQDIVKALGLEGAVAFLGGDSRFGIKQLTEHLIFSQWLSVFEKTHDGSIKKMAQTAMEKLAKRYLEKGDIDLSGIDKKICYEYTIQNTFRDEKSASTFVMLETLLVTFDSHWHHIYDLAKNRNDSFSSARARLATIKMALQAQEFLGFEKNYWLPELPDFFREVVFCKLLEIARDERNFFQGLSLYKIALARKDNDLRQEAIDIMKAHKEEEKKHQEVYNWMQAYYKTSDSELRRVAIARMKKEIMALPDRKDNLYLYFDVYEYVWNDDDSTFVKFLQDKILVYLQTVKDCENALIYFFNSNRGVPVDNCRRFVIERMEELASSYRDLVSLYGTCHEYFKDKCPSIYSKLIEIGRLEDIAQHLKKEARCQYGVSWQLAINLLADLHEAN